MEQLIQFDNHMLAQPDYQRQVARVVTDWFCRQAGAPGSGDLSR